MQGSRIFVGNLDGRKDEEELIDLFRSFGDIASTDIKTGYAFVEFGDAQAAEDAIAAMDATMVDDRPITVEHTKGEKKKKRERVEEKEGSDVPDGVRARVKSKGKGKNQNHRAYKVIAISGSARKASPITGLVRYAAGSHGRLAVTHLDTREWPLFNMDLISDDAVPKKILAGHVAMYEADAVIIATPEYNYGCAPGTTNAVAWFSKAIIKGKEQAPLVGKPCGLMSAGGGLGGMRAQLQARSGFTVFLDMPTMCKPELAVRIYTDPSPFNMDTGDLVGADTQQKVEQFLLSFQTWVANHTK